ncbi:MAG: hypothetical protein L0332_24005 [Chloroflexi bacterium]|nr:hypothetical protein [Chloroflexota bacterium]MCI0650059.1 hypothetical protein [Chloroflexota bacterium]MCI0729758.1 hypothetical protein [Chloroflexota bacterium]
MAKKRYFTCLFNNRLLLLWLALLVACFGQPAQAEPNSLTFTVNNSLVDALDAVPGDGACETAPGNGTCTVRAAIMEANSHPNGYLGPDTIVIPAGTFELFLAGDEDAALTGDLDITESVIINGAGVTATIMDGNGSGTGDRVFEVHDGVTAAFNHLTIQDGQTAAYGGGLYGDLNVNITLNQVIVQANQASVGGGIFIWQGGLAINGSAILGNSASAGGGIGLSAGMGSINLSATRTLIANNTATADGGGLSIPHSHEVTLINTTVSGNSAHGWGGGIAIQWTSILHLYNATVVSNKADWDGNGYGVAGGLAASVHDGGAVYIHMRSAFPCLPTSAAMSGTSTGAVAARAATWALTNTVQQGSN